MGPTIPLIHECFQTSQENEKLKAKLKEAVRRYTAVKAQLDQATAVRQQPLQCIGRTTKEAETQTDSGRAAGIAARPLAVARKRAADAIKEKESERSKFITTHENLLRRYDRLLQTNAQNAQTIAELTVKVHDLEMRLQAAERRGRRGGSLTPAASPDQCTTAKRRRAAGERSSATAAARTAATATAAGRPAGGHRSSPRLNRTPQITVTTAVIDTADRGRQNRASHVTASKWEQELKNIDEEFFEELEDLKYALQQSTKLNAAYEDAIAKLCRKHSEPDPFASANFGGR